MRTLRLITPLALAAGLLLTGCSDDPAGFGAAGDPTGEEETSAQEDSDDPAGFGGAEDPTGEEETSAQEDSDDNADVEVPRIDADDVVASYDVENVPSGAPGDSTVTVGVHSLQVLDDVMLLELYYTPNVASGGDEYSLYEMNGGKSISPLLIDRPNLTQYEVIGRQASRGWSVDVGAEAMPGETVLWWGYFAAPPEDVEALMVQVHPDQPILEIPVQR